MKKLQFIGLVFLTMLFLNCKSYRRKRNYQLSKRYMYEYLQKKDDSKDTIPLSSGKIGIKNTPNKIIIVKLKNGNRTGKWFYYEFNKERNRYECYRIVKKTKNDSVIIYSSRLINYRYW